MSKVRGGTLLARALAQEGVRCLFTLSGGCLTPIYDACLDLGIEIVHARSEGAAAFMADGWARATRQIGVCAVTSGPGVTNALTALMTAKIAASPVLLLAGRYLNSSSDMGASQAIDHLPHVRPVTKWARSVTEGEKIPEYMSMAFRQALSGRPGPVFLDIIYNALISEFEEGTVYPPTGYRTKARPYPDPALLDKVATLIESAERPILVAGSGTWWSGASEEVRRFAEATGIPVFVSRMGRGAISADHPLHFGLASLNSNRAAAYAAKNCDLLLIVGARFDYHFEYGRPPYWSDNVKVVQIDVEAEEIGHNRTVDAGIVADAKAALTGLIGEVEGRVKPKTYEGWRRCLQQERAKRQEEHLSFANSDREPIHPLRLLSDIASVLEPEDTVVVGHGGIDFWGDSYFETYLPGRYLRAGSFGPLGAEIPLGLAAQFARPRDRVIVLVGDGGFGYAAMEFETAARYGLPIVVVIGNDSYWGAIKQQQEFYFGPDRCIATDLKPWNYEKLVEAFGGHGEFVRRPAELKPALERALDSGVPACVNVLIDCVTCPFIQWNFNKVKPRSEGESQDV